MQFLKYVLLLTSTGTWISAAEPNVTMLAEMNQKLLAKQKSSNGYEKTPQVVAPAAPSPVVRKTFSERISFLSDGQMTVMVPMGALIHSPAKHRISIQEKIQGRLVEWDEFLQANRNDIRLEPVDIDQLQGNTPLSAKAMELVIKANLPTLASYHNRVVSLPAPRPTTQAPTAP